MSRDQSDRLDGPRTIDMSNNNTVNVEQYDVLKAKYLTVDRSYESLKALARKGECSLCGDGQTPQLHM